MRKRFVHLMVAIFYSLIGLFVLISINCGGGGGGGDVSPTTTTTETTVQSSSTTSTTTTIPPSSDALIGNFRFVYQIISTWTDRITLVEKSNELTSEGTFVYIGYDADFPSVVAAGGAWMPSISKYIVVTVPLYSSPFRDSFVFTINADNTLPGCYMISADSGNTWSKCYSFILPQSHKTPLGSWDISLESQHAPIDFDEVFGQKIAEDLQVKIHQSESTGTADGNLISKINELKTIIENRR